MNPINSITLPVAELKPALIGLGKIISRRMTLPVLGCLLVQRNPDGWVTLTATDLDSTASVRLEQPGEGGPASLLVPFAELQKTVKSCKPGEDITVAGSGNQVTLRYPIGSQFAEQKVESLPVEDFPPALKIDGTPVPLGNEIRQAILEAMQCASTDETRVILNGCYLDMSDQNCQQIVATDWTPPLQQQLVHPAVEELPHHPGPQIPGMEGIHQRRGMAIAGAAGCEGQPGPVADQQPAVVVHHPADRWELSQLAPGGPGPRPV